MIKILVAITVVTVGVLAELPRVEEASYPASGWKPAGPPFPEPHTVYGPPSTTTTQAPAQEYGPPQQTYGPPEQEYGTPVQEPSTELPSSTENSNEVETVTPLINERNGRLVSGNKKEQGTYYIYHPTGVLQKVVYNAKDSANQMEFSARLRYEVVEPIRGPIYTYDNDNLMLRRL